MTDGSGPPLEVAEALETDLGDPALYATGRPERVWAALRALGRPVRMPGRRPHWAVTGHAQIRQVLQCTSALSSEQGNHLGDKPTDGPAAAAAGGLSLLVSDGDRHAAMRSVLGRAFRPRTMRRLTAQTRSEARRLITEALEQGEVDFVRAVSAPLPAKVVCALLGVPPQDTDHVVALTGTAFGGTGTATAVQQMSAHAELFAYCDALLTRKRARPDDDVASVLAAARIDGATLPREVAVMNCHDLIAGGNETARHTVSAAVLTFDAHQPYWAALRRGEADLGVATEEMLRFETPVSHVLRVLRTDLTVGGVTMPEGDLVTLWVRSGNRDEAAFAAAGSLDPHRRPNPHLAFGHGPHYCVAAELARIEVAAVLQALVELVAEVEATARPTPVQSNFFRGFHAVPVVLRARS